MNRAAALLLVLVAGCSSGFGAGSSADGGAGDVLVDQDGEVLVDAGGDARDAHAGDAGDASEPVDAIAGDVVVDQVLVDQEDAGGADAGDACAPVTHADGFGQSFHDCDPAGDYTEQLAIDACGAFTAGAGGVACVVANCTQQGLAAVCTEGLPSSCACWVYSGTNAGHARLGNSPSDCPCDDMVPAGATTAYQ